MKGIKSSSSKTQVLINQQEQILQFKVAKEKSLRLRSGNGTHLTSQRGATRA
jgi:hypothetical protein